MEDAGPSRDVRESAAPEVETVSHETAKTTVRQVVEVTETTYCRKRKGEAAEPEQGGGSKAGRAGDSADEGGEGDSEYKAKVRGLLANDEGLRKELQAEFGAKRDLGGHKTAFEAAMDRLRGGDEDARDKCKRYSFNSPRIITSGRAVDVDGDMIDELAGTLKRWFAITTPDDEYDFVTQSFQTLWQKELAWRVHQRLYGLEGIDAALEHAWSQH